MDLNDREREFGEVASDALKKLDESEVVAESGGRKVRNFDLDDREARALRLIDLVVVESEKKDFSEDESATYLLIRLTEEIFDKLDYLDEEAETTREIFKEELNFDELDPEEKEEAAQRVEQDVQNFRKIMRSSKLLYEVIVFYMIAGSLMEKYTCELMQQRVISDDFQGDSDATTWIENWMNQSGRETVLKLTGAVSEDFASRMGNVRTTRNELAHNVEEQLRLEIFDDLRGEITAAVKTLNDLHKKVYDYPLLELEDI